MKSTGLLAGLALFLSFDAASAAEHFLYTGSGNLAVNRPILERPNIGGAQVVCIWRQFEPEKGRYDSSPSNRIWLLARTRSSGVAPRPG